MESSDFSIEQNIDTLYIAAENAVRNKSDRSLEYCLRALRIAKQESNELYEGMILLLMSQYSLDVKNYESSLAYAQKALIIIEEKSDDKGLLSRLHLLIGEIYFNLENYDLALESYQKVLVIEYENDDHKNISLVFQKIGDLYTKRGQYNKALEAFENSLEEFEFVNKNLIEDAKYLSDNYRKIAKAFMYQNNNDKALDFYLKALDIQKTLNDQFQQGLVQKEIGFLYLKWNRLNLAKFSLLSAYGQIKDYEEYKEEAEIQNLIGEVYYKTEDYATSLDFLLRSIKLYELQADFEGEIGVLQNISKIYEQLNNGIKSKQYLEKALIIAQKNKLVNKKVEVLIALSGIYAKNNNLQKALELHQQAYYLKDSIYYADSGEKYSQLKVLYDIARKENQNKILRQNTEIQKLQIDKNQYYRKYLLGIIFSVTVVLVLVLFRYWSRKKIIDKQKENEIRILELNRDLEKRVVQELKKQEKQQQLLAQKSKMESLGSLAAGIAHEINQPLGGISMGLDNVLYRLDKKNLTDDYLKEKINLFFQHIERIERIIEHVRIFSRTQKPLMFEKVYINEVVNNSLMMIKTQYQKSGIVFETNLQEEIGQTIGDKFKLEQVLLNLLSNAKYAVEEREKNTVPGFIKKIRIETYDDEKSIYLKVVDNGIGMDSKTIKMIFDPFFTTKKAEKGTGLGLSITYGLIRDMLGDIKVTSELNSYTKFEISLPRSTNYNV